MGVHKKNKPVYMVFTENGIAPLGRDLLPHESPNDFIQSLDPRTDKSRPDVAKRNAKASNLNHDEIMTVWNYLRETTKYGDVVIDQIVAERLNEKLKKQKKALITTKAIEKIRSKLQTKDDPFSDPRYE